MARKPDTPKAHLRGHVWDLIKTLRRYLWDHGNPPQPIKWDYPLSKPLAFPLPEVIARKGDPDAAPVKETGAAEKAGDHLLQNQKRLVSGLVNLGQASRLTGCTAFDLIYEGGRVTAIQFDLRQEHADDSESIIVGQARLPIPNRLRSLLADPTTPPLRDLLQISRPVRALSTALRNVSEALEGARRGAVHLRDEFEHLLNAAWYRETRLLGRLKPSEVATPGVSGEWLKFGITFCPIDPDLLKALGAASDALGKDEAINPTVTEALRIIRSRRGRGLTAKEIVSALKKKHIVIGQPYFRRHVVPQLKAKGIENHRARGGYYDPNACRKGK
jgi:hypothetical protein